MNKVVEWHLPLRVPCQPLCWSFVACFIFTNRTPWHGCIIDGCHLQLIIGTVQVKLQLFT